MILYAGIDEAGYGPMFGPMVVARTLLAGPAGDAERHALTPPPDLWRLLKSAVCRRTSDKKKRIAINDSKLVYQSGSKAGVRHLELGTLAFAGLGGHRPAALDGWLDLMGESCHRELAHLPWYAPCDERPWGVLPSVCTEGEVAIARSVLAKAAATAGVQVLDMGAAVVFEDRFNRMVATTRSKAAASFTFVSQHLHAIWERYGADSPTVVVDRQSGRSHYRELLALLAPEATLRVIEETADSSVYVMTSRARGRQMTVRFEVEADSRHLPTALASMIAKYTRELLMARFQAWFAARAPQVRPTAGYAKDGKRFWAEIEPMLGQLAIRPELLRRMS